MARRLKLSKKAFHQTMMDKGYLVDDEIPGRTVYRLPLSAAKKTSQKQHRIVVHHESDKVKSVKKIDAGWFKENVDDLNNLDTILEHCGCKEIAPTKRRKHIKTERMNESVGIVTLRTAAGYSNPKEGETQIIHGQNERSIREAAAKWAGAKKVYKLSLHHTADSPPYKTLFNLSTER